MRWQGGGAENEGERWRKMEAVSVGTGSISELELQRSTRESSPPLRKVTTSQFTQPGRHTHG